MNYDKKGDQSGHTCQQTSEEPGEDPGEEPHEGRNLGFLRLSMRTKITAAGLLSMLGLGLVAVGFVEEIYSSWEDTVFSALPDDSQGLDYPPEYETSDLIKAITQEPDFFTNWKQVTWTVCLTRETEGRPGFVVESWYRHVSKNGEKGGSGAIPYMVEWINSTCFQTYPRPSPEGYHTPYPDKPTKSPLIYYYQASVHLEGEYILSPLKIRWLTETDAVDWEDFRGEKDKIALRLKEGLILHAVLPRGVKGIGVELLILEYKDDGCSVRSAGSVMYGRHALIDLGEYGISEGNSIHRRPDLPPLSSLVIKTGTRVILVTALTEKGETLASDVVLVQPN